ncbi:MAG: hypothetical protein IGR93_14240 [Hydrococcus sp. C42_A2020_068]|uniref:hypothetical protein n=1 Tax=Pleurocapsa sp. PCC 7327 TaxID=118163 RepID=UPI00029F90A4|nr:hypothetical protein [Pleurocapsa sp. PCC 7327]AFY79646.1 hypothetical protein Ple7327_4549 [Pleurocapsa sp. PCC 7327]MBF2021221.1 hypothetical protein [Hydrococcus sp. C42_A2020_068]
MFSASKESVTIRNYILALASAAMMGILVSELYNQPDRIAQQGRLDNYSRFIGVGLVSQAQKAIYR